MKSKKILVLAALLSMIVAGGLWAQTEPTGFRESPQSASTRGRYRSNADDFIRPDSYTSAKLDKWYGMTSFADNMAVFGFATKINSLYLGAYLGGTLLQGLATSPVTSKEYPFPDPPGSAYKTFDTYGAAPSFIGAGNPNNRVAILLGVADMGIRLSYGSTYQSFNGTDICYPDPPTIPNPDYPTVPGAPENIPNSINTFMKSYKTEYGVTSAKIDWSMAKDLSKAGIRPYAYFDILFFNDYTSVEKYNISAGDTNGSQTTRSQNRVEPRVELGLGGFAFYNENGFKGTVDLDYRLRLRMYDNEYSWQDGSTYKTEKIKGIYTGPNVQEIGYLFNWIRPSLSGSWSKDNVALKFKMNLVNSLTTTDTTTSSISTTDGKLTTTGHTDVSVYQFAPGLDIAMQYKIVPDKLALNTGFTITPATITTTTTKSETYTAGKIDDHSAYTTTNTVFGLFGTAPNTQGADTTTAMYVGATFNFSNNVSVEAATGINGGTTNKSVNVFDTTNGLLAFSSILLNLKF